jgi:hypothetical protein
MKRTNMNDCRHRFVTLLVAASMTVGMTFPAMAESFSDVSDGDWFKTYVDYVSEKGFMVGTGGEFNPEGTLNRAQGVTVLYAMEGKPSVEDSGKFNDLAADWYKNAVNWAVASGITVGKGNGKFAPDDPLTREQIAVMMKAYAKIKGYDTSASADLSKFSDSGKVSSWAKDAMKWAVGVGIISGKVENGKTVLAPGETTTRAQFAAISKSFNQKVADNSGSGTDAGTDTKSEEEFSETKSYTATIKSGKTYKLINYNGEPAQLWTEDYEPVGDDVETLYQFIMNGVYEEQFSISPALSIYEYDGETYSEMDDNVVYTLTASTGQTFTIEINTQKEDGGSPITITVDAKDTGKAQTYYIWNGVRYLYTVNFES